jgi:translation initiation factor IF-3
MMFRGREIAYTDIGRRIMEGIKEAMVAECVIDQQPKLEGRNMVMILSPKK